MFPRGVRESMKLRKRQRECNMRFLDYIKELLFYSLEKKPSAVSQYQTLMISSALFLMCVCVCVCV